MLSDEAMRERMSKGWRGGLADGTVCGNGSTLSATANAREWLPRAVRAHSIISVNDAGAGDMYWMKRVSWPDVVYKPFDLIPRHPSIAQIDITRETMPEADAILCRMVLNHLDEPRIQMALIQFRRCAKYLIATQFHGKDLPQRSPQFMRLDLCGEPFNLGEPIDQVQDGREPNCRLALWKL